MDLCATIKHITKKNFPLSSVSSMKTGGRAEYAFFPETEQELIAALAATEGKRRYIIGNSSNVLFPDNAENLCVIFTTKLSNTEIKDTEIYAESGTMLTALSANAARCGLSGLEFAYGIPGTVGGGVYMNAGAYGGELSSVISYVRVYDTERGKFSDIPKSKCGFSYRHSIFMENRALVIVGASLSLKRGEKEQIESVCRANMQARRDKQPLEYPSCGSAFKRPEGHFAGKLIEDCGLKGFSVGGAQISEKHAGFVINCGGATSGDVLALMNEVKRRVFDAYGVTLEPEIEIIEE